MIDIILTGPSPHLSWAEMACRDEQKTPYPVEWRTNRAIELSRAFEMVRELCGFPLIVDSAYRTEAYNRSIGGAVASQHVQGRALDLRPSPPSKSALKRLEAAARRTRDLGLLRGVGIYSGFIHIDTRPGQAATWYGSRGPETK